MPLSSAVSANVPCPLRPPLLYIKYMLSAQLLMQVLNFVIFSSRLLFRPLQVPAETTQH